MSNARNISKAESRFVNATGDSMSGSLTTQGALEAKPSLTLNGASIGTPPRVRFDAVNASYTAGQTLGGLVWIGGDASLPGYDTERAAIEATNYDQYNRVGLSFKVGENNNATPVEKMYIDSEGRVTMPYQPAFFFDLAGTWPGTPSSGDTVPWGGGVAHLNVGGSFNTSTHRFTAPVAGKYSFSVSLSPGNTSSSDRWQAVRFVKNGSALNSDHYVLGFVTAGSNSNQYDTLASTIILSLSAGDYIETKFYYNGFSGDASYGQFSGHLLG